MLVELVPLKVRIFVMVSENDEFKRSFFVFFTCFIH